MSESTDRTQLRVRLFLNAKAHNKTLTHPQITEILNGLSDSEVRELVQDSNVNSVYDVFLRVLDKKITEAIGDYEQDETEAT